jgi:hypothetical protein
MTSDEDLECSRHGGGRQCVIVCCVWICTDLTTIKNAVQKILMTRMKKVIDVNENLLADQLQSVTVAK